MICGTKISWKQILKEVSFELKKGRITTFMGKSGAGKTTLLKCIANLHSQYEGVITCEGKDVKTLDFVERASTIGFVSQQFHLFPHLSVLKNCTYALVNVLGMTKIEAEKRALDILDILSMASFIRSYPSQLSGGQQQRVAIARTLALEPKIVLFDEPTSALDPESKKSLETLLLELNARGITLALSCHDMPFIRKITDSVYFIENGELIEAWDREAENYSNKIKQFLTEENL